ncbi:MAG: PilZ domain-containing protein [Gammaproteobacteria bacterium]|nr:PilZ domain-containing protein [Gammaproteobacteria bacterium]
MSNGRERRQYERVPLRTRMRIMHESFGEAIVRSRDLSHGGVFIVTGDLPMPPVGTIIEGQVQDEYGERPLVKMEIMRFEPDGVGVKFCD